MVIPNFCGTSEVIFHKHLGDGVGGVRSSLGRCMQQFFDARKEGDERMAWNFRAMNVVKDAKRQNDDKALSS